MSEALSVQAVSAIGNGSRTLAALGAADWLGLAAAPTFAIMAQLTHVLGGGKMAMSCGGEPSLLGGMALMYLLMSLFHAAPWLRLIAQRRRRANRRWSS